MNEKLQRSARDHCIPEDDSLAPFLCECPRRECTDVVVLTLAEYEDVRSDKRGGVAAVGHEDLSVERVVAQNERFVTTSKFGEAGDVYADQDPRR